MGYLHCVFSSCAEVRYQPYKKKGGIRYRYPGEEWVIIDGDDYSINHQLDFGDYLFDVFCQCKFTHYGYVAQPLDNSKYYTYYHNKGDLVTGVSQYDSNRKGKVIDYYIEPAINQNLVTLVLIIEYQGVRKTLHCNFSARIFNETTRPQGFIWLLEDPNPYTGYGFTDTTTPKISFSSNFLSENYHFIVYKNNNVVFQQTSNDKPEVELIESEQFGEKSCQLSDRTKIVKIEKIPLLERIDVVDHAYQNFGLTVNRATIPDHCLNIYKPTTPTIAPLPGGIPTPSNSALDQDFNYGFVEQICSDEGCPPPRYVVVCHCGEECPPGTCPVRCSNSVCCYDTNTGKAVAEILLENYSGGGI